MAGAATRCGQGAGVAAVRGAGVPPAGDRGAPRGAGPPEATIDLPRRQGTVVLAFDVSSSMKAKDLAPTRMAAAKQAARTFVADQPSSIRIGVVAFSDAANVVQPPTRSQRDVLDAIGRSRPRGGTALGRGILTSLGAVAKQPITLDQDALEAGDRQPGVRFLGSAAVVLLSDGDNTAQLDPLALAPVGVAGRRAHLPGRDRQPQRRGGRHRRLLGRDRARRRAPAGSPPGQRRHLLRRRRRRRRCGGSTTASTSSSRPSVARPRSPRCSQAAGWCSSCSQPGSRCAGTGG